ncbi:coiled-coil domain-containing protein 9 isoform X2 [Strigops habroptila]|uniref:coiled-coil domain-containing protein 9 isoform X2 n=1 Tax=Strigops habroptila TaxID=2489341 RepID=UPI0011CF558E|nr:coiled-coil domain-containing protein 9 isoform X2 [Strigops habroptila]
MSAALDLRSKEEKDAELDRRIAALRRKNEAIIRRYQEIEEDRKKAEQEGVAVTTLHRARDPSGATQEQRPGKEKKPPGAPRLGRGSRPPGPRPSGRPPRGHPPGDPAWEGAGPSAGDWRPRGRGLVKLVARGSAGPSQASKWEQRRRQNIERMNEEMEKIAEYEQSQRDGLPEKNPVRNFLDDPRRSGPSQDSDRRDGSRRHGRNWGGPDFDKVKTGMERDRMWPSPGRHAGAGDMTLSMTGRERAEYLRWKQERERIDRERVARHRKPGGQWRREWDAEKSDSMFLEGSAAAPAWDSGSREELRRPAPKPPTLGEFLPQQKPRGRGRGLGAKSYSMHDNRWEEKEPEPAPAAESWETEETPTEPPLEPPHSLTPEEEEEEEEEEEQWEDVSEEDEDEDGSEEEEEEEEEEEDDGSTGSLNKEEAPPRLSPLESPQRDEVRLDAEQEAEDEIRALDPAPGTVEITDFHRVRFRPPGSPPAPSGRSGPGLAPAVIPAAPGHWEPQEAPGRREGGREDPPPAPPHIPREAAVPALEPGCAVGH